MPKRQATVLAEVPEVIPVTTASVLSVACELVPPFSSRYSQRKPRASLPAVRH